MTGEPRAASEYAPPFSALCMQLPATALTARCPSCTGIRSASLPPHPAFPAPPRPTCLPAAGFTLVNDQLHSQLYGEGITPQQILAGAVAPPPEMLPLYQDIEERAAEARVRACSGVKAVGTWHG